MKMIEDAKLDRTFLLCPCEGKRGAEMHGMYCSTSQVFHNGQVMTHDGTQAMATAMLRAMVFRWQPGLSPASEPNERCVEFDGMSAAAASDGRAVMRACGLRGGGVGPFYRNLGSWPRAEAWCEDMLWAASKWKDKMIEQQTKFSDVDWQEVEKMVEARYACRDAARAQAVLDVAAANHPGRFRAPTQKLVPQTKEVDPGRLNQGSWQEAHARHLQQQAAMMMGAQEASFTQQAQRTTDRQGRYVKDETGNVVDRRTAAEPNIVFGSIAKKPSLDLYVERGAIFVRSLGGTEVYRFESADELDALLRKQLGTKAKIHEALKERDQLKERLQRAEEQLRAMEGGLAKMSMYAREQGHLCREAEKLSIARLLK